MPGENITLAKQIGASLNLGEIVNALPPELISKIDLLIDLVKIIGVVFLIYIIFLVIKSILSIIEKRRIKFIYKKVIEIDEKLDRLLNEKKKNRKNK